MKTVLEMTLQSGAFILLMLLIRPWMKKRLSARLRYALWLLPFARLCLPVSLHSALSLWRYAQPRATAVMGGAPAAALPPAAPAVPSMVSAVQTAYTEAPMTLKTPGLSVVELLPILWAAGAACALMLMAYTNIRFLRAAKGAEQVAQRGKLPVLLVKGIPSPCLAGLVRPRIYINEKALVSREMLDMVLLHETTHHQHKDHLWTLARALMACIWWWDPLIWLAAYVSRADCEAACDEAVIQSMNGEMRRLYGMSLISLMRRTPERPLALTIGTSMSGGKRQMKERIQMIAFYTKKNKWIALICVLCAALLTPMVMTGAARNAELTDKELIQKAEETVLSHYVLDDGIEKMKDQRVSRDQTIDMAGRNVPADEVKMTAVNEMAEVPVSVYFAKDTGEALRLIAEGDVFWENITWLDRQKERLEKTAYIRDPRDKQYAVSLCQAADDYGLGKEMLLHGVEVTVHWITPTLGGYPHDLFDDPKEEWAYITVGANRYFEGAHGYVPVACLSWEKPESKAAPAFVGKVTKDKTALYADTGLTDTALMTLTQGASLRVLGRTMKYWHVETEGKVGFVPADDVVLSEEALAVLPVFNRDNLITLQPGWEKRQEEYEAKRNILYNRNPPMGEWSLEQMAEGSRLAEQYGMLEEWIVDKNGVPRIFVVPGDGDLKEEEALRLADKAAMEKYGFSKEDVTLRGVNYYYTQDKPEERLWNVRYSLMIWQYDCSVTLNRKGEVIDYWQMKGASGPYPHPAMKPEDALMLAKRTLIERGYVTGDTLNAWAVHQSYKVEDGVLLMQVTFMAGANGGKYKSGLTVEIDDAKGTVKNIIDLDTRQSLITAEP